MTINDTPSGSWLAGKPVLVAALSLLVPGLGQMATGKAARGAAILAAAIVIGNLNLVFLLVFSTANLDPAMGWAYWLPRIGHDVLSLWSVVFWVWAVIDAYRRG